jgi:hypothetical protein
VTVVTATIAEEEQQMSEEHESEIKIRREDLPKDRKEFGLAEKDFDLSKAKAVVYVHRKRAEFHGDKDGGSITVKVPSDASDGPLTIVVITDAGKTVAVLKYRRDGHDPKQWKNQKAKDETPKTKPNGIDESANKTEGAIEEPAGKTE